MRQIAETEAEEISCSECLDHISEYVDREVSGAEMTQEMRRVAQHLHQCQVCLDDYEILHDLVVLEDHGEAPSLDDLKDSF